AGDTEDIDVSCVRVIPRDRIAARLRERSCFGRAEQCGVRNGGYGQQCRWEWVGRSYRGCWGNRRPRSGRLYDHLVARGNMGTRVLGREVGRHQKGFEL